VDKPGNIVSRPYFLKEGKPGSTLSESCKSKVDKPGNNVSYIVCPSSGNMAKKQGFLN
jgi:hypothetical protein